MRATEYCEGGYTGTKKLYLKKTMFFNNLLGFISNIPSMNHSSISVIVPVRNGGQAFYNCLKSLSLLTPAPLEVIVVADGNLIADRNIAEKFEFISLFTVTKKGPGIARNLGAQNARGDLLFFVDADVVLPTDAISKISNTFFKNPDLAAIIGSYDDDPSERNFLSQYRNLLHHYIHQTSGQNATTFWGACGAIKRDIFNEIGGFSNSYQKFSVEDIELGYRLCKANYKILLSKDFQVKHQKRWSLFLMLKTDIFHRAMPWSELIFSMRRFHNDLNLKNNHRASTLCVFFLLSFFVLLPFHKTLWIPVAIIPLILIILNFHLYHFFLKKRGLLFSLRVIPMHWFYYLYGGFGFVLGFIRFIANHSMPNPPSPNSTKGIND